MNVHSQCMALIQTLTSETQGLRRLKFPMAAETGLEVKGRCGCCQLQAEQVVVPAVWPTQRPSDPVLPHTVLAHATLSGKGEPLGNCTPISQPQCKNISQERTQNQTWPRSSNTSCLHLRQMLTQDTLTQPAALLHLICCSHVSLNPALDSNQQHPKKRKRSYTILFLKAEHRGVGFWQ